MNSKKDLKRYAGEIIDSHCHILSGIDDGAQSIEQSIDMLRIANNEGISTIVATPHIVCDGSERHYLKKSAEEIDRLRKYIQSASIPLKMRLGYELLLSPLLLHTEIKNFIIENTNHILVELNDSDPEELLEDLRNELDHYNIKLVIAHPERARWLHINIRYLEELVGEGAVLQINAESVLGTRGKEVLHFSRHLIDKGLVYLIGSDAHSNVERAPYIRESLSIIQEWIGKEKTEEIAYKNARNLLKC